MLAAVSLNDNQESALPLEIVRPTQADIRLQGNAHDAIDRGQSLLEMRAFDGLSGVSVRDEEISSDRHAVFEKGSENRASNFGDGHPNQAVVERLGSDELELASGPQMESQLGAL